MLEKHGYSKKKKKKEKKEKIQMPRKLEKNVKQHLLDLHGPHHDKAFFFSFFFFQKCLQAGYGCLATSTNPKVDTIPCSCSTILRFFSPFTPVASLFIFSACFLLCLGSMSAIEELIKL